MPQSKYQIGYLILGNGRSPFLLWYSKLDMTARIAIQRRLEQLRYGNFGSSRKLASGLAELKLNLGPGLRIYYGLLGREIVLLLSGGNKKTQARDIERARDWWLKYTKGKRDGLQNKKLG